MSYQTRNCNRNLRISRAPLKSQAHQPEHQLISRVLSRIKGVVQRVVHGKLRSDFQKGLTRQSSYWLMTVRSIQVLMQDFWISCKWLLCVVWTVVICSPGVFLYFITCTFALSSGLRISACLFLYKFQFCSMACSPLYARSSSRPAVTSFEWSSNGIREDQFSKEQNILRTVTILSNPRAAERNR